MQRSIIPNNDDIIIILYWRTNIFILFLPFGRHVFAYLMALVGISGDRYIINIYKYILIVHTYTRRYLIIIIIVIVRIPTNTECSKRRENSVKKKKKCFFYYLTHIPDFSPDDKHALYRCFTVDKGEKVKLIFFFF